MNENRVVTPEAGEPDDGATRTTVTHISARPTIRVALPDGWARAALSGVEAAFIGWALTVLTTCAGFFAISGNSWMKSVTWEQAFSLGSDLWGAFLGARLVESGVTYVATPLAVPLFLVLLLRLLLTGGRSFPQAAQWMSVPFFTLTAVLLVAWGGTYAQWWTALPLALLIPLCATVWAVVRYIPERPTWMTLPTWVRRGVHVGCGTGALLALMGSAALLLSIVASWEQIRGIHALLLPASLIDDVLIVVAQVLFVPNALTWAISWLAGPGFYLGADAVHTPSTALAAPIPAVPLFGAVPSTAPGQWVIVLCIAVGVVAGVVLCRKGLQEHLREHLASAVVATVVVCALYAGLAFFAGMSLGAERLSVVGPRVGWTLLCLALEVGSGLVLTALVGHPTSVAAAKARWELMKTHPGTPTSELPSEDHASTGESVVAEEDSADEGMLDVPRVEDSEGAEVPELLESSDLLKTLETPEDVESVEVDMSADAVTVVSEETQTGDESAQDVKRVNLSEMPTERLDLSSER